MSLGSSLFYQNNISKQGQQICPHLPKNKTLFLVIPVCLVILKAWNKNDFLDLRTILQALWPGVLKVFALLIALKKQNLNSQFIIRKNVIQHLLVTKWKFLPSAELFIPHQHMKGLIVCFLFVASLACCSTQYYMYF